MVMVIVYEEYENKEEIEILIDGRYAIDIETGEVVGEVFSYE
jgi:hypothetical protein